MTEIDITKLSKRNLLNDIDIFFFREKKECNYDLLKLKKKDLIKLMLDYNIPHITDEILKEETLKIEKNNKLRNIVNYNFHKYNNIPADVLLSASTNEEYEKIIENYNLTEEPLDNELEELIKLIKNISSSYKNYCLNTNKTCNIKILSLPHILEVIKTNI
jgi:hypothetical protein